MRWNCYVRGFLSQLKYVWKSLIPLHPHSLLCLCNPDNNPMVPACFSIFMQGRLVQYFSGGLFCIGMKNINSFFRWVFLYWAGHEELMFVQCFSLLLSKVATVSSLKSNVSNNAAISNIPEKHHVCCVGVKNIYTVLMMHSRTQLLVCVVLSCNC